VAVSLEGEDLLEETGVAEGMWSAVPAGADPGVSRSSDRVALLDELFALL
jgi:hypothetical protein